MAILDGAPSEECVASSQKAALASARFWPDALSFFNWTRAAWPSHKCRVDEVMAHLKLEHISFTLKRWNTKDDKIWQPFILYYKHNPSIQMCVLT